MKKLILLFTLLGCVVAFSRDDIHESNLETWCKANEQVWEPGICYIEPDTGYYEIRIDTSVYINKNERLIINGKLLYGGGYIDNAGSIIVRDRLINFSNIYIHEGGKLVNFGYILNCYYDPRQSGTIENYGTIYNLRVIYNADIRSKPPGACAGFLINHSNAAIHNFAKIRLAGLWDEPPTAFDNFGTIYNYPCANSSILALYNSEHFEIGGDGLSIDLDHCAHVPLVVMD